MSGKKSRDKGCRRERELVKLLRSKGIGAKRVPLSGAAEGFKGDVITVGPYDLICPEGETNRWEVKSRRDGWKELYRWLEGNDALALKADGKPWLVVMRLE